MGEIKQKFNTRLVAFKHFLIIIALVLLAIVPSLVSPAKVLASSECNVDSLNPENPPVNSDTGFDFFVSDSINDIRWAQITAPSDQLMLYDGFSPDLVNTDVSSSQAVFNNGDVPSGVDTDLHIDVQIGDYFPPANWTVEVSSDPNGANPVTCGGTTDIEVSDTTPPNISSIEATVLSNSATIGWQTDKLADSQVQYGTTSNYGLQQVDSSYDTSHAIVLKSLQPNTTYHYMVTSTDEAGNVTSSLDSMFTTPAAPVVPLSVQGFTPTSAPTNVLEPVVTNASDTTPPGVQLSTKLQNPYKTTPVFSGTASDKVAVARIEYSTDDGKDWLPVDSATGLNTAAASFSFTPVNLDNGTYQVMVRVTNAGGKVSVSNAETLVIDRIPPNVGGDILSVGTQILAPDSNGNVNVPANVNVKLSLDAVGGPIKVDVIATNLKVQSSKPLQFPLIYNPYNTLWQGNLNIKTAGTYRLLTQAVNGIGQEVSRQINNINVEPAGQITDSGTNKPIDATVTIYDRDPITQTWSEWDGSTYSQANPYLVTGNDGYSFLLPAGTYYLRVSAPNYNSVTSSSFTENKLTDVSGNFMLHKALGLHIGSVGFNLPIPNLGTTTISTGQQLNVMSQPSAAVNKPLPAFSLPLTNGQLLKSVDLLGKPTILTFITTWAPPAEDQLSILNKLNPAGLNVIPVSVGESSAALAVYNSIGSYSLPILADTNQQLVAPLSLSGLPTTYFVDRQGVVKKVMVGVLSSSQLMNNLEY